MTSTTIYELRKARGGGLYAGDDSAKVQRLLLQQRRPGPIEHRKFWLVVRSPGETAVHLLVRARGGSVKIEHTRIWRSGGSLLEILARAQQSTPPTTTGRTVWDRLRDPWPSDAPPAAEEQPRSRPAAGSEPRGLLSAAELEAFARWDQFTEPADSSQSDIAQGALAAAATDPTSTTSPYVTEK